MQKPLDSKIPFFKGCHSVARSCFCCFRLGFLLQFLIIELEISMFSLEICVGKAVNGMNRCFELLGFPFFSNT